jgi:hypothetical protein
MRYFLFLVMVASALALTPPITNFNVGQVSPLLDARTDTPMYSGGSRTQENMIPRVAGDISKRPGTTLGGVWDAIPIPGAYPMLHELDASEIPSKPSAPTVADGTTTVTTGADLLSKMTADPSGSYRLTQDIDMTAVTWVPILNFSGTLDGDGFTISNLTINSNYTYKQIRASDGIDTTTDIITVQYSTHIWNTGDEVQWRATTPGPSTMPAPLVDLATYYIIKIDSTQVQLATSYANAIAGTQIDITTIGSFYHRIQSGYMYTGLIGTAIGGAKAKDLTMDSVSITGATDSSGRSGMLIGQLTLTGTEAAAVKDCHFNNSTGSGTKFAPAIGYTTIDGTTANLKVSGCTATNNTLTEASGGLLGEVRADATSSNETTITDCHVYGGEMIDGSDSGGLIGLIYGDYLIYSAWPIIHSCSSSMDLTSTQYQDMDRVGGFIGVCQGVIVVSCHATGDIISGEEADLYAAGGFMGNIGTLNSGTGKIINCYSTGDVKADPVYYKGALTICGGFIGKYDADNYTLRCYSTGDVSGWCESEVGGFIGFWAGSDNTITPPQTDYGIDRCWSTGDVLIRDTWNNYYATGIGGFVGSVWKHNDNNPDPAIRNSYCWGSVISYSGSWAAGGIPHGVGGFCGAIDDEGGGLYEDFYFDNCYAAQTNVRTGSGLTNQITYRSGTSGGFIGNDGNDSAFDHYATNCYFDQETTGFTDDVSVTADPQLTCEMFTKSIYEAAGWSFSTVDQVKGSINDIWYMPADYSCSNTASGYTPDAARLIPFVFSTDDSYILAFDAESLGFLRTDSGVSGRVQQ